MSRRKAVRIIDRCLENFVDVSFTGHTILLLLTVCLFYGGPRQLSEIIEQEILTGYAI